MLRRVRHRLARREHEHVRALVERGVTGAHDVDPEAVKLLDLGGRRLDGLGERPLRRRLPVGIEPGAQLALLPPCERRHTACIGGIALDERERLQHRVVDARGEVGSLLRADARGVLRVPLADEPPRPRREHEHERRRDRTGCEQRRRRAVRVPADEEQDADDREDDRGDARAPLVEPEGRASGRERGSGRDQCERPDERVGEAEASKRDDRRPDEQDRPDDPAPARRRSRRPRGGQERPRAEVREDPRAAREREQREHEPHERRIDRELFRNAAAHACEHAVALHALEARERNRQAQRADAHPRTTSTCPSPTRASSTSTRVASVPVSVTWSRTEVPLSTVPNSVTLPALDRASIWTVTSFGTWMTRSPMPSVDFTCVSPMGKRTPLRSTSRFPMPCSYREWTEPSVVGCAARSPMPANSGTRTTTATANAASTASASTTTEPTPCPVAAPAAISPPSTTAAAASTMRQSMLQPVATSRRPMPPSPAISAPTASGPSERRRARTGSGSPGATAADGVRSRVLVCHQTIAAPASAAATQRLPGLGHTRADESARIPAKPIRPTPTSSHGRSRCSLIAPAAIESCSPSSGITSHAAT